MADTCPSVPNEPREHRPSHPHPHLCTEVELSEDYLRDNKHATKKPKKVLHSVGLEPTPTKLTTT